MDVFRVRCSKFNAITLTGYRKGAYAIATVFGTAFKNINYETMFGMVIHQNMDNGKDVLVEVFQLKNGDWMDKKHRAAPIPYETLKKLTIGTNFHDLVVDRDGHAFISGLAWDLDYIRPSYEMCRNSHAWDFFRTYGAALAIALKYPDVVHDLTDGLEFDEKVHDIINFASEMKGSGLYTLGIENARKKISSIQEEMEEEDRETSESHRQFSEAVETLEQYGINYKKRKVA